MTALLLTVVLLLALVNGANDNFKGVATLHGSGELSYHGALALGTLSTLLGSLVAVRLAPGLVHAFSARNLVPEAALTPTLMAATGLAAFVTVLIASLLGMPVSTTHALVGGLAGSGLLAVGPALNLRQLGASFALPLLVGPALAVPLALVFCAVGRVAAARFTPDAGICVCASDVAVGALSADAVGPAFSAGFATHGGLATAATQMRGMPLVVGTESACAAHGTVRLAGVRAPTFLRSSHLASAGLVGFSRGLNDTPKLIGLLLGAGALGTNLAPASAAIAVAMAAGGLIGARRVAETLSRKLTPLAPGPALAGNLATSLLVVGASRLGLPVSTTHVATGAVAGIGLARGSLASGMAATIGIAWLTTLPLAAALGAAVMWLLG